MNDAAAEQAVAAVVSEAPVNGISAKSGAAQHSKLLPRWELIGRAARDARLSRTDIAVLYVIANRIGDSGTAWPSVRRIAHDAGVDQRTVSRANTRLCNCGYLVRKSGNFTNSNEYRLGTGESTPTDKSVRTGEPVAKYGRTRPKGMGESAHVISSVNLHNQSIQESSTATLLVTNQRSADASTSASAGDKAAARSARLAEVTRDAVETFNASELTKANGGLVPNVTPGVGEDKRRKHVARCLQVARDICNRDFESNVIVRDFWVEYWELCREDEHKSGRAGGGKDYGKWLPSFEYLTREDTMLSVYERAVAAAHCRT